MDRLAEHHATRIAKTWWKYALAGIVVLIGIVSAFVMLYSGPVLTPNDNRDLKQPFRLKITLANRNAIPLEHVRLSFFDDNVILAMAHARTETCSPLMIGALRASVRMTSSRSSSRTVWM
jgi:hypothetical protein